MNTRYKKLAPIPYKPSTTWHIMHEEYYPIFLTDRREQIEYWYNKTATGKTRDTFRRICQEMYSQNPNKEDPEYNAEYTRQVALLEVKMILKNYGLVLSELGKTLARVWLLHKASQRDKESFREVFTGAQSLFIPTSVMKADYISPDIEEYIEIDRTHFLSSVDWANLPPSEAREKIQQQRLSKSRLSLTSTQHTTRITKPKNQFDGISPLAALGYKKENEEEAIEKLRTRMEAHKDLDRYYTIDNCTVYVAGGAKKMNPSTANSTKHGVIATVCGD